MAAGYMPPGDERLNEPCVLCEKPIEAGQRFYAKSGWKYLGHVPCVEDNLDRWDEWGER